MTNLYIILNPDDLIEEGDEYWNFSQHCWMTTGRYNMRAETHQPYRRKFGSVEQGKIDTTDWQHMDPVNGKFYRDLQPGEMIGQHDQYCDPYGKWRLVGMMVGQVYGTRTHRPMRRPVEAPETQQEQPRGLRDDFAIAALQAILTGATGTQIDLDKISDVVWKIADVMIRSR